MKNPAEVWDSFKTGAMSRVGILIAVATLVAIGLIVYFSIPKVPPPTPTAAINEAQAAIVKQLNQTITDKTNQVRDYQARLTVSESRYGVLAKKLKDLQEEKEHVKAPTTNKELRDRFTALGYTPLAASK